MVKPEDIVTVIDPRKNKILLYAQLAMQPTQFSTFRKLFLDELGNDGFVKDLYRLFAKDKER